MKRLMCLFVVCWMMGGGLYAQDAAVDDVATFKATIEQLKRENAKLKEENQLLRKLALRSPGTEGKIELPKPDAPRTTQPKVTTERTAVTAGDAQETGYWLTTSSSKRHNSKCRYYKASQGRSCEASEGIACKICGG